MYYSGQVRNYSLEAVNRNFWFWYYTSADEGDQGGTQQQKKNGLGFTPIEQGEGGQIWKTRISSETSGGSPLSVTVKGM